jgi:hypothetical protein
MMWSTDTRWFDVAVVMSIFAVGNIVFGHFEEHRPKWRRLLKVVVVLAAFIALSEFAGRTWAFGLIGVMLVGALYIHAWWLPRRGVNGLTGEPRDRYYEIIGYTKHDVR